MSAHELVTLHITYFNTDNGDYHGKREVFHASFIAHEKALIYEQQLQDDHDSGKIQLIEIHKQYKDKRPTQ